MADIPPCANAARGTCKNSDVRLVNETSEGWVFQCKTCECIQVVSKDGVRERSKFEKARRDQEERIRLARLKDSRRRIFA